MGEPQTVLVAEDSPTQAEQLRHLLESGGYRVVVAQSGEKALELARAACPDVVVTDIIMPGMDGYELCKQIKNDSTLGGIPVVLLTSLSDPEDVLRGLECGADNFITKPYDGPQLLSRLQNLLLNRQFSRRDEARLTMEVHFHGRRHTIDADRMQVVSLLLSSYENAVFANKKLEESQRELARLNEELETRVRERTEQFRLEAAARREAERQLYQAQKMDAVGRLAGGVAHDFNNMLMVIRGFVDVISRDIPEGDRKARHIASIRKAVDRAADLTQQLLLFSRKDAPAKEELDLNEVVAETTSMLRHTIGEHIAIESQKSSEPLLIEADRGELTQVLMNLSVNARDAMTGGGTLGILTRADGPWAELVVRDTGSGMDQSVLEHIFEPFFTTKARGKGTGLGLSVVYGIVTALQGTISCRSELGKGTVFTVRLPLLGSPRPASGSPWPAPATQGGSECVLVVEDDDLVRGMFRATLQSSGYRVLDAADAKGAAEALASSGGSVAILLVDMMLPNSTGLQIVESLRASRPDLPAILTSGYAEQAHLVMENLPPRAAFLSKPVEPDALLRCIRELLDRGAAPQSPA